MKQTVDCRYGNLSKRHILSVWIGISLFLLLLSRRRALFHTQKEIAVRKLDLEWWNIIYVARYRLV